MDQLPKSESKNLKDQLQRAVVSIGLNIAEGCNSEHDQEFIRFLNIAKNSAFEVIAITLIAESLYNIKPGIVKDNTEEIIKMINGLRNI